MIIKSLTDLDWYKINMEKMYFQYFADISARYEFKCRDKNIIFTEKHCQRINEELDALCTLRFTEEEIKYISSIRYHKDSYGFHEFFRMFQLNRNYIHCSVKDGKLEIYAEGPIWQASMFEIFVLEIVSEVYFEDKYTLQIKQQAEKRLRLKLEFLKEHPFRLTDFGCRRRISHDWQDHAMYIMREELNPFTFSGTSNVYFAQKYNIPVKGTMAHEILLLGQALDEVTVFKSQNYILQKWCELYRGDLGIALTDCLTLDFFLRNVFDRYFAMLFSGVRHDSGDPFVFGNKMLEHYNKLGIDPSTKTLMFSDSLNFEKAVAINEVFKSKIKVEFGIGTFLMHDCEFKPLNIVMKPTIINGKPVAKISDSDGKCMCDNESYLSYLKEIIKL
jgi:nicotinate phosphoribosyltransferase